MRRRRAADLWKTCAAAAVIVLATAMYTWPLPVRAGSAIPHDAGDPLLVTWILWWSSHVVPLTTRWWNAPAFYPSAGVFAFSENLLGLAPLTAPLLWSGQTPLLAYNTAFLASFVLSGLGAYLLGFVLTRQHGAAFVCAIAFAFTPYRLSHLNHLQLLSSYWMPVAAAALHLYGRAPRPRWAALFAFAWLMQALACGYYFFFLSIFIVLWLAWFARHWTMRRIGVVAGWWLIAMLLMAPLLAGYKRIQDAYGFHRAPSEIAYYSADVAGLAAAAPESRVWHALHAIDKPESELFPGVTILLLLTAGAIGTIRRARHTDIPAAGGSGHGTARFYALTAVAMWLLALGPVPHFRGRAIGVPGPYAMLMVLPGFNGMRVPARLWMIAVLCLAAAAAIVVSRIRNQSARRIVVIVSAAGLLMDGWPVPLALASDPGMQITHGNAVARLGLPLEGNETETMYGAIAQGRPVFNGYSGYTAPQHYALGDLLDRGDPRILERLASGGPIEIIVRHRLDPRGRWRAFVASYPGARISDETAGWTAFQIPATPAGQERTAIASMLTIAHLEASVDNRDVNAIIDGDLDTRWHAERQSGAESIVADLGAIQHPSIVLIRLGTYASQYPRTLEISTSVDGSAWQPGWTGDTALLTYDAAVASPREIPLRIPLSGGAVRYLRLRQIGSDPGRGWSIVELQVMQ